MMRVVRRAIWEGGGIRAGFGLRWRRWKVVAAWEAPSLRRPERIWIAAVSVCRGALEGWDGRIG
jgi:hypothetical protein